MKTKFFPAMAIMAACFSIFLISCKKDKDESPSLKGYWVGKYGNGATTYPDKPQALLFRENGTLRVWANTTDTAVATKAEGTYTVAGNVITCSYTYLAPAAGTYSVRTEVNTIYSFMEGSWGSGSSTTSGGKVFFAKK
jgi:hypothetical protein